MRHMNSAVKGIAALVSSAKAKAIPKLSIALLPVKSTPSLALNHSFKQFLRSFATTVNKAMANPQVFFDMSADNQPLGRIVMEVGLMFLAKKWPSL